MRCKKEREVSYWYTCKYVLLCTVSILLFCIKDFLDISIDFLNTEMIRIPFMLLNCDLLIVVILSTMFLIHLLNINVSINYMTELYEG